MLNQRKLGRTGISVTELGFGTFMSTGEFNIPREEGERIFDFALRSDINLIDTAPMYGFGEGEELTGRAILKSKRQDIVVGTKLGWLDRTVVRPLGDSAYVDAAALRRVVLHSLWLLRRETIDLLVIHEPDWDKWKLDYKTGSAVVTEVLESLKKEGLVRAIGLGGWNCDLMADLLDTGRFDVALVAGAYTLVNQPIRARLLDVAKRHNCGIIVGAVFLQGALAEIQREWMQSLLASGKYPGRLNETLVRRVLAAYELSERSGISLAGLALRYILADPAVSSVIVGAKEMEHLRRNVDDVQMGPLPSEIMAEIRAINAISVPAA